MIKGMKFATNCINSCPLSEHCFLVEFKTHNESYHLHFDQDFSFQNHIPNMVTKISDINNFKPDFQVS